MAHFSLALLGPLRVHVDGRPVERFAYTRSQALLAYLATESDRPHRRDTLVGLLWPELPAAGRWRDAGRALDAEQAVALGLTDR